MKTKVFLFGTILILATVFLFINFTQSTSIGPHGGKIKPAQNYNIEAKTEFPFIYAYLLDKKNDPIANNRISCEISFLLPDNTRFDVHAKTIDKDGFVVESSSLIYNSFRVTFFVSGKTESALFENENNIVLKKSTDNK